MTGRVRERFTRTNGELLLFPHSHDLLGNWTGERERDGNTRLVNYKPSHTFVIWRDFSRKIN